MVLRTAVNHTFCSTLDSDIALSDDNDTVLHPVQGCRSGWQAWVRRILG